MENNETTPETTTETTTEAAEAPATAQPPADPSIIGRLTPEEQQGMMGIKAQSQQLLAKVGEYELLKLRVLARIEELDEQGQAMISAVTKRLNLKEGEQWVGMQDGTIRLVTKPDAAQTQQEGGSPSS